MILKTNQLFRQAFALFLLLLASFSLQAEASSLAIKTGEYYRLPATLSAPSRFAENVNPYNGFDRNMGFFEVPSEGLHLAGGVQSQFGVHTNTFNIPNSYLALGYREAAGLMFFAELQGQVDTHDPSLNYSYVNPNISFSNLGFGKKGLFAPWFSAYFMGAATHRMNRSNLLLSSFLQTTGDGLLDPIAQYQPANALPRQPLGPGIRLEAEFGNFVFGYSQADFKHSIPISMELRYRFGRGDIALLSQFYNFDAATYRFQDFSNETQLMSRLQLLPGWFVNLDFTMTLMHPQRARVGDFYGRLETGVLLAGFLFPAVRVSYSQVHVADASGALQLTKTARLQAAVRAYLGARAWLGVESDFGREVYLQAVMTF